MNTKVAYTLGMEMALADYERYHQSLEKDAALGDLLKGVGKQYQNQAATAIEGKLRDFAFSANKVKNPILNDVKQKIQDAAFQGRAEAALKRELKLTALALPPVVGAIGLGGYALNKRREKSAQLGAAMSALGRFNPVNAFRQLGTGLGRYRNAGTMAEQNMRGLVGRQSGGAMNRMHKMSPNNGVQYMSNLQSRMRDKLREQGMRQMFQGAKGLAPTVGVGGLGAMSLGGQ